MDLQEIIGRKLALLLVGVTTSEEEPECAVLTGIVREHDGHLVLDRAAQRSVELRTEWHERIRPTPESARSILLDADYFIRLTVGNVTEEEAAQLEHTGFKWPT